MLRTSLRVASEKLRQLSSVKITRWLRRIIEASRTGTDKAGRLRHAAAVRVGVRHQLLWRVG